MATTQWINAGTAETNDFTLWDLGNGAGTTGSSSSSTQAVFGSVRSFNFNSGSGNDQGYAGVGANQQYVSDGGTRITFGFRYSGTLSVSGGGADFINFATTGGSDVFSVGINNSGILVILSANAGPASALATGTHAVVANTDTRITVSYTLSSTTVNTIQVYVNGVLDINASNLTLANNNSARLYFGWGNINEPGANVSGYVAHIYIDNGTTGDPGNIRTTVKRAFSNGTSVAWATSGSGSGYGSGHASFINGRPPSTSNIVSVTPTTAKIDEYNVEGISAGDVNITGVTLVDWMGWINAEAASTSNTPAMKIIVANVSTTITIQTAYVPFTHPVGSTTYPAGTGTDVGMSAGYTTTGHLVSMDAAGVTIAYIAPTVTATNHFLSTLGAGT
jgi:hypothetical protein